MFLKRYSLLIKTIFSIAIPFIIFLYIFNTYDNSLNIIDIHEIEDSETTTEIISDSTEDNFSDSSNVSTKTAETDQQEGYLKIGETANFDGVEFTLEKAYLYDGSDTEEEYYKPEKGKIFLMLDIKVNNTTSETDNGNFSIQIFADGKSTGVLKNTDKSDYVINSELLPNTFYEEPRA